MSTSPLRIRMLEEALGGHWVEHTQSPAVQTSFSFDRLKKLQNDQLELRAVFRATLYIAFPDKPCEHLAEALNMKPSYCEKIRGAINGEDDRKVQWEWFAPLLENAKAAAFFAAWFNDRLGFQPPIRVKREVAAEDEVKARRKAFAKLPLELREVYERQIAEELGVDVEDLPR